MKKVTYCNAGVSKSSEITAKKGFLNSGNGWEEKESLIKKMAYALGLARWMAFGRKNGRKEPLKRIIYNLQWGGGRQVKEALAKCTGKVLNSRS